MKFFVLICNILATYDTLISKFISRQNLEMKLENIWTTNKLHFTISFDNIDEGIILGFLKKKNVFVEINLQMNSVNNIFLLQTVLHKDSLIQNRLHAHIEINTETLTKLKIFPFYFSIEIQKNNLLCTSLMKYYPMVKEFKELETTDILLKLRMLLTKMVGKNNNWVEKSLKKHLLDLNQMKNADNKIYLAATITLLQIFKERKKYKNSNNHFLLINFLNRISNQIDKFDYRNKNDSSEFNAYEILLTEDLLREYISSKKDAYDDSRRIKILELLGIRDDDLLSPENIGPKSADDELAFKCERCRDSELLEIEEHLVSGLKTIKEPSAAESRNTGELILEEKTDPLKIKDETPSVLKNQKKGPKIPINQENNVDTEFYLTDVVLPESVIKEEAVEDIKTEEATAHQKHYDCLNITKLKTLSSADDLCRLNQTIGDENKKNIFAYLDNFFERSGNYNDLFVKTCLNCLHSELKQGKKVLLGHVVDELDIYLKRLLGKVLYSSDFSPNETNFIIKKQLKELEKKKVNNCLNFQGALFLNHKQLSVLNCLILDDFFLVVEGLIENILKGPKSSLKKKTNPPKINYTNLKIVNFEAESSKYLFEFRYPSSNVFSSKFQESCFTAITSHYNINKSILYSENFLNKERFPVFSRKSIQVGLEKIKFQDNTSGITICLGYICFLRSDSENKLSKSYHAVLKKFSFGERGILHYSLNGY